MKISTNASRCYVLPVLIASLAVTVGGCASSRYTVLEPPNQPVINFDVVEIRDFTSALTDEDSVGLANRFADQLHAAVMRDRQQHPMVTVVNTGFDEKSEFPGCPVVAGPDGCKSTVSDNRSHKDSSASMMQAEKGDSTWYSRQLDWRS